jgi:hypothetical protein
MGSFGASELLVIFLVLFVILLFIVAPFLGIRRAAARQKRRQASTVGVVLPAVALGVEVVAGVTGSLSLWFCSLTGCLAATWLYVSVQANKAASKAKSAVLV